MSWRVIGAVVIAIFAMLLVSASTAAPLYGVTDTIVEMDSHEGDESQYDIAAQAASGVRAYGNLILIMVFGTITWGAWYLLRQELTGGRL